MKLLLLRHFEKGALGLAVLFLGVMVATPLLARPAELELQPQLDETIGKIARHFEETRAPEIPLTDAPAELKAELGSPLPTDPFGGWLAWRRPNLVYKLPYEKPKEKVEHLPPVIALQVTHGAVTVSWGPGSADVSVLGYVLTRTDEKKNVVVLKAPDSKRLVDDQVEPCHAYAYRIEEKAEAPKDYEPLSADKAVLSAEKTAVLPRDFILVPDKEVVEDNFQLLTKVFVYRWKNGEWPRKEYWSLKKGDKIGKKEKAVDFSTGAEILGIEKKVGFIEVKVRWPDGREETVTSKDTPEELKKGPPAR